MSRLQIRDEDIPSLHGKVAVITGASSGIGYAAAKILSARGARVYMLDLNRPDEGVPENAEFVRCSVTSWSDLLGLFKRLDRLDIAVANAGVSEETNYFQDTFDAAGDLIEPRYGVIDVNLRGVLNFVKLSLSRFRQQGTGGSIVITASATAYAPEHSLPVYSATKLALIGLVRSLRPIVGRDDITINAVAPAATITKLLPQHLAAPIVAAGLPVSSAHMVGLAVAYSATATEKRRVEPYGKDPDTDRPGRWNGRTILTLGDDYTELEEPIAKLREEWFGRKNTRLTRMQQSATDFRHSEPVP